MAEKLGAQQLKAVASPAQLNLALPNLSKFDRLSRSLDEFGSNVAGMAIKAHEDAAEKDRKAGAEAAAKSIAAGRDTLDQMVEDKVIERGEHSFFRDGALEQMGRAHAASFSNAIMIEAAEQNLAESIDPEDMGKVIAKVAADFNADDQGEAFGAGFAAEAADVALGFEQRHAAQVAANIESGHNDQVTDKYRAEGILVIEGSDPSVLIESLSLALQAKSEEHLGIIPDPNRGDYRRSNRALTDTLISFIDDGSLTGEQAIEVLKNLRTPSGSLFAMAEHAPRIEAAADAAITRDTSRDANEDRIKLQEKQRRAIIASEETYAAADENGVISMDLINQMMRDSDGTAFTASYIDRMRQSVSNSEAMAAREYHSDPEMLGSYTVRIMEGEAITAFQLSADTHDQGGLNPSDAARLFNSIKARNAALASDPVLAAMDSRARYMVKEAVGGFAGKEFGAQAWLRASVDFQAAFNKMREGEGKDWTAESPKFAQWTSDFAELMQKTHLMEGEWAELQRGADVRTALHVTDVFQKELFASNPNTVIHMYAQALEWQENGREPDNTVTTFFNRPDNFLPEEEHTANNYVIGLEGQLLQMDIDLQDDRIDVIRRQLDTRPRAGTEGGSSTAAPIRIGKDTGGNTATARTGIAITRAELRALIRVADSTVQANAENEDGSPADED